MKFKQVSQKEISTGLPTVIGAGAGVMVARGISGSVIKAESGVPLSDKQKKTKLFVALGCMALGAYGYMAIDGNDAVASGAKGLALGTALNGVLDIASHIADKSPEKPNTSTPTGRFLASALGCPCQSSNVETQRTYIPTLQMPRSLRMPIISENTMKTDLGNFAMPISDLSQLAS